ncbi:MAG: hypothetical protein RI924_1527 [Bacteroidota bacterium]|jgi:hypothetical protein
MKKLIYLCSFLTAIGINKSLFAQQKDAFRDFKLSFMKEVNYPRSLRDSCITTATIIRITKINAQLSITLSDSATQPFKEEFNKVVGRLNTNSLRRVLDSSKATHSIIIPLYFTFDTDYCASSVNIAAYASTFNRFNGEYETGECNLLEPIIVRLSKPIIN